MSFLRIVNWVNCLGLLLFSVTAFGQKPTARVSREEVWSWIDTNGNAVDGPDNAPFYADDRGNVKKSSSLTDTIWQEGIGCFGLLKNGQEQYRYLKNKTTLLMDSTFDFAEPFKDGYGAVMSGDDINWMDRNGNFLLKIRIPFMSPLNTPSSVEMDRILVLPPAVDKSCNCMASIPHFGYVTKMGEWALAQSFLFADIFVHGLARASSDRVHFGFIDTEGNWAVPPVYDEVQRFEVISE